MPRTARLDVPDVLQHVMARGIEGRDVFRDKKDREAFLRRLSDLVGEGNIQLLAWSVMPNHFHLLLRTHGMSLATMMSRLMTGYAVWHNRRHDRKGHLFQNRYKSIVVEEDPYFLELVRYIHLNPVRGNILENLWQLDRYPYSGHAVLMGHKKFKGQDVEWVLGSFGRKTGAARKRYREFMEAGFHQGPREDLRGGGLIRSAGGREQLASRSKEEWEKGDERILGRGDFVEEILKSRELPKKARQSDVTAILDEVARKWKITPEQVLSRSRSRKLSQARRAFFLLAHEEGGESITELGRLCGITHSAVKQAMEKARLEQRRCREIKLTKLTNVPYR
jgi:REP element-mobilizing transposase RayT